MVKIFYNFQFFRSTKNLRLKFYCAIPVQRIFSNFFSAVKFSQRSTLKIIQQNLFSIFHTVPFRESGRWCYDNTVICIYVLPSKMRIIFFKCHFTATARYFIVETNITMLENAFVHLIIFIKFRNFYSIILDKQVLHSGEFCLLRNLIWSRDKFYKRCLFSNFFVIT